MNRPGRAGSRKRRRPAATPSVSRTTSTLLLAGGLTLLVVIAYLPAFQAGFIWDDDHYVTHNSTLRTFAGLLRIWTDPTATPQYYPLVHTMFWVEYHLWHLHAVGYHVVNVLLHATAAVLLLRVLKRLAIPWAPVAALVFALHPVQVESVAWVTERKNVLSACFYLGSALAFIGFRWPAPGASPRQIRGRHVLSLGLFVAALLSKTITCSLPAALLLTIWWKEGRLKARDWLATLPMFAAGLAAAAMTVYLEKYHVGAVGAEWSLTPIERLLVAGRAVVFYAVEILWPANLTFIYPRWTIDAGSWWQYLFPLAVAAAAVVLLARVRRWGRGPLVAFCFFVGTLVPALGLFDVYPMRYSFVADHFQYLASIGMIVGVLAAAARWLPRAWWKPSLAAVAGLLLVLSWNRACVFRSNRSLWEDTIARNPGSWMAYSNLGEALAASGQLFEAVDSYRKSIEIKPDQPRSVNNLGAALYKLGRSAAAAEQYRRALELEPDNVEARTNLAFALLSLGKPAEARDQCSRALKLDPDSGQAHNCLGLALSQLGQGSEAEQQYTEAIRCDPSLVEAYNNLGNLLSKSGRSDLAMANYRKAVELNPDSAHAHNNLGTLLSRLGRRDEAIEAYRHALRLGPDLVEVHNNMGSALAEAGHTSEAIEEFRQAIRLNPDYLDARTNLALTLRDAGQLTEAIDQLKQVLRIKPDFLEAINELGSTLRSAGRPAEAIQQYEQALRLKPDYAIGHLNLAITLADIGQRSQALEHCREASRLARAAGDQGLSEMVEAQFKRIYGE